MSRLIRRTIGELYGDRSRRVAATTALPHSRRRRPGCEPVSAADAAAMGTFALSKSGEAIRGKS